MILVDAHVHIHDCFRIDHLFDGAVANFQAAPGSPFPAAAFFLLLTEGDGQQWFGKLVSREAGPRRWQVRPTSEAISLQLKHPRLRETALYLVAGRQVVTAEKLEVLALLTGSTFPEGRPLAHTVAEVIQAGGLAALPWGAGKWLGRRKKVLQHLLAASPRPPLFLADNGGRPSFWPFPEFARRTGLPLLAGSDPLPFPREEKRVGRFGFRLGGRIDGNFPAAALKALLLEGRKKPVLYGAEETPWRFLRNQAAMQVHKRRGPGAA